jgi:hypothetical protein
MGVAAYNRGSRVIRTMIDREAEEARQSRRCLCGIATVGAWTGQGVHHGAHRCARVGNLQPPVIEREKK